MPGKSIALSLLLISAWWSDHPAVLRSAEDDGAAAKGELSVADLLALPDHNGYRVDPYLKAAQSLQALGQRRACELLRELAKRDEKEGWPYTRTLCLCRMLFQAKPKSKFRRAYIGGRFFPASTTYSDWPLEPIEIIDGVPFHVSMGAFLSGQAEAPADYLRYCIEECVWSNTQFQAKSMTEKKKALGRLLSSAKLNGQLRAGESEFFEAQIK